MIILTFYLGVAAVMFYGNSSKYRPLPENQLTGYSR